MVSSTNRSGARALGRSIALALALFSAGTAVAAEDTDPWQGLNRGIFRFNDALDVYLLEPVAKGWDYVVPDRASLAISDFFANLRFPVSLANNLLQGKLEGATVTTLRFVVNTSVGIAGFFDPASHFGLNRSDEDFGQTLATWHTPAGPYVVVPFLGPSTVRDTGGMIVDSFGTVWAWFLAWPITTGANTVNVVNLRSRYIDEVATAKQTSLDYYVFVRNAYLQRRQSQISDSFQGDPDSFYTSPATSDDDLYYFDEEN